MFKKTTIASLRKSLAENPQVPKLYGIISYYAGFIHGWTDGFIKVIKETYASTHTS